MARARSPNLTAKQEKYVQGLYAGLSQRDAYKQAYSTANMKDRTIDSKASLLFKKEYIRARLEALKAEFAERAFWTKTQAVEDLIWVKDKAKESIENKGINMPNSQAFLTSLKELNEINNVYSSDEKEKMLMKKLKAEVMEKEAKVKIVKHTADILTNKGETNDLMKALLEVQRMGGIIDD